MKLIVCLCLCIVVVVLVASSPVDVDPLSDRCPLRRRQLEDVVDDAAGVGAQAAASTSMNTAAAVLQPRQAIVGTGASMSTSTSTGAAVLQPLPEIYETSKRLSPGGPNPQHH